MICAFLQMYRTCILMLKAHFFKKGRQFSQAFDGAVGIICFSETVGCVDNLCSRLPGRGLVLVGIAHVDRFIYAVSFDHELDVF